jgi:hypothetical protein
MHARFLPALNERKSIGKKDHEPPDRANTPRRMEDERLSGANQEISAKLPKQMTLERATTESTTLQPPLPPHVPQSSTTLPLLGTPSQPVQVALLPPHTPHASRRFEL